MVRNVIETCLKRQQWRIWLGLTGTDATAEAIVT